MIPPFFIRSTIFNICFYTLTALACIALLPTLMMPRKIYLAVVYGFVYTTAFLEKYILGLTYEVRGIENLSQSGGYIVAAKHQSAYETFKLHILFGDPAIVLKKELLKIPLWGKYLEKSDVIPIDRSSPKMAIKSIQDGAKHVADQGRPMVIFPQGTRVSPDTTTQEKPYKIGIVRMQEATNLPIIPMALNTGIFYPKHCWCKKPGRVIFEFLKPINASEQKPSDALKRIEEAVEEKTHHLMEEGRASIPKPISNIKTTAIIFVILTALWCANWYVASHLTRQAIERFLIDLKENPKIVSMNVSPLQIKGFPFSLNASINNANIETFNGEHIELNNIHAHSLPFLGMPIEMSATDIKYSMPHWSGFLFFDRFQAEITHKNDTLNIIHSKLNIGMSEGRAQGTINFASPYPQFDLILQIERYEPLLIELVAKKIVKEKPAMFAGVALKALERDGVVTTTLASQDNKIYLGPIRIIELPKRY